MRIFRDVVLVLVLLCSGAVVGEDSYLSYATRIEAQYGLPPHLLSSICYHESHGQNIMGAHGEIGVCQLKPDTVRHAFGESSWVTPKMPYLAMNSRGTEVRKLQELLSPNYGGPISKDAVGVFGEGTRDAVISYQGMHHLRVDGVVGPQTWGSLLIHPSIEEQLWNPLTNVEYAAKYLQWLSKVLGTTEPMILAAAYNGGPGNSTVRYMVGIRNGIYTASADNLN